MWRHFQVETNIVVSHAPRVRSHDCPIAEAEFHQLIEDLWKEDRDFWWHELMKVADDKCKNMLQSSIEKLKNCQFSYCIRNVSESL